MNELRIQYNIDIRTPTGPDDPTCYDANGLPILDEFVADDARVHFEALDTAPVADSSRPVHEAADPATQMFIGMHEGHEGASPTG